MLLSCLATTALRPSLGFQVAGLSQVFDAGMRFNTRMPINTGIRLRGGGQPAVSSLRAEARGMTEEEKVVFEVIKTPIEVALGTSAEKFSSVMQSLSEEGKLGAWNIANLRLRHKDAPCKEAYKAAVPNTLTPHEAVAQGVTHANGGTPEEWRARRLRHEAAHFLVGYILGLPIQRYEVQPEPRCIFYEPKPTVLNGTLSVDQMNKYAVLLFAGIQGELSQYDNVVYSDRVDKNMGAIRLHQLEEMYAQGEPLRTRESCRAPTHPMERETHALWAAQKCNFILSPPPELRHFNDRTVPGKTADALQRLAQAMERGGGLVECIAVIEAADLDYLGGI